MVNGCPDPGEESTALVRRETIEIGMLRAGSADALVASASEIATALAGIINSQKLYSVIQGRKFVHVEGWTTLGAMLGIIPREVQNEPQDDGSFVATVELVRLSDGTVIGRASSECGDPSEQTWAKRARYARRSMAATRATGKAFRLSFSWIMKLAGYEPTPAEEMPNDREEAPVAPRPRATADKGAKAAAKAPAPVIIDVTQGRRTGFVLESGKNAGKDLADLSLASLSGTVHNAHVTLRHAAGSHKPDDDCWWWCKNDKTPSDAKLEQAHALSAAGEAELAYRAERAEADAAHEAAEGGTPFDGMDASAAGAAQEAQP